MGLMVLMLKLLLSKAVKFDKFCWKVIYVKQGNPKVPNHIMATFLF